jgi:opacity protein-like surface antigen
MRYRTLCAGLLASVAASAGAAVAADLPVRGAPPPLAPAAAPAYISEWAGFYVGIHGGGGWGHESFENSVSQCDFKNAPLLATSCAFDTFLLPADVSPHGGVFGFQFGHNWQWGPVVGGLELDYSGADLTGSSTFSVVNGNTQTFTTDKKIDALASVRGRLGYLIFPNWLFYGTAGIGWGHERIGMVASDFCSCGALNREENATSFLNMFGWVAGAGVEWKFANNWLLRGEWLHYDFLRVTNSTNNPEFVDYPFFLDPGNVKTTVDVARAAISYKFGP